MAWYRELTAFIRNLFRRDRFDRELREEFEHHLALETAYNVQQGIPVERARRDARRAFGPVEVIADETHDARGAAGVYQSFRDVRFAARSLTRRAGFASLVVITLGFGIGCTTGLFAVVKSVLLAPLPYGRPAGIAVLWSSWKGFPQTWLSYDEYEAWKGAIPAFADVALYSDGAVNLTGDGAPERVRAANVGANLFSALGVSPILGRTFTADEDRLNGPRAAIVSFELWERRYGADPSIVGKTVQVDGATIPVVGVLPRGFKLPIDFGQSGATAVYYPLATSPENEGAVPGIEFQHGGGSHGFYAVARLAPTATIPVANQQLNAYVEKLTNDGILDRATQFRAYAVGIEDQVTGSVRTALVVLLGAVAMVLLIACANVAALLLVRGERRRRELAIRVALGAEGRRLTRLLFAESALLAGAGAALGVLIAWGAVGFIKRIAPPTLPRINEAHVDPTLLFFAVGVTCVVAVLIGLLPALQAMRISPAEELKEGGKGATSGHVRLRWRQTLVTAEVALAVVLVIGAGLMVRSVGNLLSIDPGFDARGVLTMRLSTPSAWYPDAERIAAFYDELQRKTRALPQVRAVGAVRLLPLAAEMGDWGLRVEGYTPPPNQGTPGDWQVVTPGYFESMGLRLQTGRWLDERDGTSGALSLVVNRRFTQLYLDGRPALGTRVWIGGSPDSLPYTIVGVVDDVKANALTRETKAQFYVTLAQFARAPGNTTRSMSLTVRTAGDPRALIAPVRSLIQQLDPRLPVSEVRTMDEIVNASIAEPRFAMALLGLFGVVALTLAAIGVFGAVTQIVALREHEFGIRAALGARPAELLRLSLTTGLRQTVWGIGIGVFVSLVATRALQRLLEGVGATDPLTFAGVVTLTALVALLASALPARRAARSQPAAVLRTD
ncbi:MAG: ABC transporter permease [Gemmatimonadaceae bacterium]